MPDKSALNGLDWGRIASHFRVRAKVSQELLNLHDSGKIGDFAQLAIGATDDAGNYSAAEHPVLKLGISENPDWKRRVYRLAGDFRTAVDASRVPALIADARIKFLQIGVGSEMSCMVNPGVCWVCNVRTIWLHLAWTRDLEGAEKLLKLFREGAADSEMAHMRWADEFHPRLPETLIEVVEESRSHAQAEGISPEGKLFLWADAIASHAYGRYHDE